MNLPKRKKKKKKKKCKGAFLGIILALGKRERISRKDCHRKNDPREENRRV